MESYERTKFHPTCRGIGDGMQANGTMRNTRSPSGDRGVDQVAARARPAGPCGMAERLVVPMKPGSCEETLRISILQNKKSAVSSRHEPRKCNQQTAFASLREPSTDELARSGCRAVHQRGPSRTRYLDVDRTLGLAPVLGKHRAQRGGRRAVGD
jgi:hypothetical protein